MSKILSRDDLLSGNHLKKELVEVPELDGSVWLRELSTSQLLAFNSRVEELRGDGKEVNAENSIKLMALIVSYSVCGEDGVLLFTEEDATKLVENKISTLTILSTRILELSGLNLNMQEVTANLKKATTSLSSNSVKNSRKRSRKS